MHFRYVGRAVERPPSGMRFRNFDLLQDEIEIAADIVDHGMSPRERTRPTRSVAFAAVRLPRHLARVYASNFFDEVSILEPIILDVPLVVYSAISYETRPA